MTPLIDRFSYGLDKGTTKSPLDPTDQKITTWWNSFRPKIVYNAILLATLLSLSGEASGECVVFPGMRPVPSFNSSTNINNFFVTTTPSGTTLKRTIEYFNRLDPRSLSQIAQSVGMNGFKDPVEIVKEGKVPETPEQRSIQRFLRVLTTDSLLKLQHMCRFPENLEEASNIPCGPVTIATDCNQACQACQTRTVTTSCAPDNIWDILAYDPKTVQLDPDVQCGHRNFNDTKINEIANFPQAARLLPSFSLEELQNLGRALQRRILQKETPLLRRLHTLTVKEYATRFAREPQAEELCEFDPCLQGVLPCELRISSDPGCDTEEPLTDLHCDILIPEKSTCSPRRGDWIQLPPPNPSLTSTSSASFSKRSKTDVKTKTASLSQTTGSTTETRSKAESETPSFDTSTQSNTYPRSRSPTNTNSLLLKEGCAAYDDYLKTNAVAKRFLGTLVCGPEGSSRLDLRLQGLTASQWIALAPAIQYLTGLTELILFGNEMGDEGLKALVPAFQSLHRISYVHLSNNGISDAGAIALAQAIKKWPFLTALILSSNSIGPVGAKALADSLQNRTSFSQFVMNSNLIGDGIMDLADALVTIPGTRQFIFLNDNQASSRAKEYVSDLHLQAEDLRI